MIHQYGHYPVNLPNCSVSTVPRNVLNYENKVPFIHKHIGFTKWKYIIVFCVARIANIWFCTELLHKKTTELSELQLYYIFLDIVIHNNITRDIYYIIFNLWQKALNVELH